MDLPGNIFKNFAICKARVNNNNTFTIGKANREGTDMSLGEEVYVRVLKINRENFLRTRDVEYFTTTIQKTGQIHIPNEVMRDLDLDHGEIVGYTAISASKVPGISNGPVRERVKKETPVDKRKRESNSETFTGPMASTGQITVPSDVREKMNIKQGDPITINIDGEKTTTVKIGTGNRITITKSVRDELGLEKGDEPEIEVIVF